MAQGTPTVDQLISHNQECAKSWKPTHSVDEVMRGVVKFPSVIIVSCCDPRVIPEEFAGFSREEYVVVRNAGGRAKSAVRDIVVLTSMTQITDVVIIHHVDCGMTHLTNAAIRDSLKSRNLGDENVDQIVYGEILDLEQSVKEDVEYLRSSAYIDKSIRLHGFIIDILGTGLLKRIATA